MKVGIIAGLVALSMSTTVYAETEGRRLATLAFKSVDENQDGYASLEEQMRQAENFFVSMDADDNGILSWQEFSTWGFGMEDVAQESGREQAYETARKVVFDLWDGQTIGNSPKRNSAAALRQTSFRRTRIAMGVFPRWKC